MPKHAAELRAVAHQARDIVRHRLNKLAAEHREELILSIRPRVAEIIDSARPHAETLARWAPTYTAADILREGNKAALDAWEAVMGEGGLESRLGLLISYWRPAFKASTRSTSGAFDVRDVPNAAWYWEAPGVVVNEALNGARLNRYGYPIPINPDVLGVASEDPGAGFRLGTLQEMKGIYDMLHSRVAQSDERRFRMRAL